MEKDKQVKENFTVTLALLDAIPVVLFGIAAAILGMMLQNGLFLAGAIICMLAGSGKVAWKLILAIKGKDVPILGRQLRILMPAGFLFMLAGAFAADRALLTGLLRSALKVPSVCFFLAAACGLAGMIFCAGKFDRRDVRGNWIEQILNSMVQGCVLVGVLLL